MSIQAPLGTPCWVDLSTPDLPRATEFYTKVLGWSYEDTGPEFGGYHLALTRAGVAAGIGPQQSGETPSAWTVYLATDAVDAHTQQLVERGSSLLFGPDEVGPFGRMALIRDPHGAVVGLWQAREHPGFSTMGPPGMPAWFEVNSPEASQLSALFAEIFELERKKMEGMEYWSLHAEGRPRFGALQMTEEWEGIPPHWMSYFSVAHTDAACARVRAQGGEVKHGPFDTPFGRMAVCSDPMEAVFTLIKPAESNGQ